MYSTRAAFSFPFTGWACRRTSRSQEDPWIRVPGGSVQVCWCVWYVHHEAPTACRCAPKDMPACVCLDDTLRGFLFFIAGSLVLVYGIANMSLRGNLCAGLMFFGLDVPHHDAHVCVCFTGQVLTQKDIDVGEDEFERMGLLMRPKPYHLANEYSSHLCKPIPMENFLYPSRLAVCILFLCHVIYTCPWMASSNRNSCFFFICVGALNFFSHLNALVRACVLNIVGVCTCVRACLRACTHAYLHTCARIRMSSYIRTYRRHAPDTKMAILEHILRPLTCMYDLEAIVLTPFVFVCVCFSVIEKLWLRRPPWLR
jgi:hypothetical protein